MFFDYILSALVTIVVGAAANIIWQKLEPIFRRKKKQEEDPSYSERLAKLINSLGVATKEVDGILAEMSHVARERGSTVQGLEAELASLESKEKDLKSRIEVLQSTPLPVVEHFAKLLEPGERRSARRDFLLFGAGVVLSTIITLILQIYPSSQKSNVVQETKPTPVAAPPSPVAMPQTQSEQTIVTGPVARPTSSQTATDTTATTSEPKQP